MDITDIKRMIIGYHKQIPDNKFDNLIEEDKVWKSKLQNWHNNQLKNLNSPVYVLNF